MVAPNIDAVAPKMRRAVFVPAARRRVVKDSRGYFMYPSSVETTALSSSSLSSSSLSSPVMKALRAAGNVGIKTLKGAGSVVLQASKTFDVSAGVVSDVADGIDHLAKATVLAVAVTTAYHLRPVLVPAVTYTVEALRLVAGGLVLGHDVVAKIGEMAGAVRAGLR